MMRLADDLRFPHSAIQIGKCRQVVHIQLLLRFFDADALLFLLCQEIMIHLINGFFPLPCAEPFTH